MTGVRIVSGTIEHNTFEPGFETGPTIVASSGWCAPSDAATAACGNVLGVWSLPEDVTVSRSMLSTSFPPVSVARGGVSFEFEADEADQSAVRYIRRLVEREIGSVRQVQDAALLAAFLYADDEGLDIHVWPAPPFRYSIDRHLRNVPAMNRFIGIEFEPRRLPMTSIHWHPPRDMTYDEDPYD